MATLVSCAWASAELPARTASVAKKVLNDLDMKDSVYGSMGLNDYERWMTGKIGASKGSPSFMVRPVKGGEPLPARWA